MSKKSRILIVDDDDSLRELLLEVLESEEFSVFCCSDGDKALNLFKSDPYDLVITDFGLPKITGLELAQSIKQLSSSTPIIMLTGWGSESEPFKDNSHSIDFVLSKPFNLAELLRIVEQSLSRKI
jgi:DNA-binding response OmpR family regulator